jgi:hypothetical protein
MATNYCKRCGANLSPKDAICPKCGQPRDTVPTRTQERAEPGWQVLGAAETGAQQTVTATPSTSNKNTTRPVKGASWCSLCDKYVTPYKRRAVIPLIVGITAIIGAGASILYDTTLILNGQYRNLAAAFLSALLHFGVVTFLVLALGAFICAIYLWMQPKRCPVCNSSMD